MNDFSIAQFGHVEERKGCSDVMQRSHLILTSYETKQQFIWAYLNLSQLKICCVFLHHALIIDPPSPPPPPAHYSKTG